MTDEEGYLSSFGGEEASKLLIDYGKDSQALGQIFDDAFIRDSFVIFTGPQKSTKSFWLEDVAWRAAKQRNRVAYFQVGDMSKHQLVRRFSSRAASWPIRSTNGGSSVRWPCEVKVPSSIRRRRGGDVTDVVVKHDTEVFKEILSGERGWKAMQDVMKKNIKCKRSFLRLSCHSMLSITVAGIRSIVEDWIAQGWVPDVVIVDYSDNIAPSDAKEDRRHQVNDIWGQLRRLSQDFHNLVVTATQTNVKAYNKLWIDRTNFSEDNRKWNHINAAFGINSQDCERVEQVCRINCFMRREAEANSSVGPSVAACLPYCNPAVVATW